MRVLPLTVVALACAGGMTMARAQTLKPGLWEMQHRMQGDARMDQAMTEMQKQLDAMPPEQRRQMEAMMAARGVQTGPAAGGGMAMKVCLTREMVERDEIPANRGECRTTRQQRSGNRLTMAFTCTNPPSSGDTQVTFNGSESYASRTNVRSMVDGKAETMAIEGSGRWLSSDCGAIQPIQPPK